MLRRLHIENIAVIRQADLSFGEGFSVLTGETGAGKSIIIDSINLLAGNRASRDLVRSGEKSATVCAMFDSLSQKTVQALSEIGITCDDGCVLLEKNLHADGKSSARINGRPVTQGMLRQAGKLLINIHGQNDSQALLDADSHIRYLDAYIGAEELLHDYGTVYRDLREAESALAALQQNEAEKLRLREMLLYQIRDMDAVKPKEGEEEKLENECSRLQNLEKIQKQVSFCERVLDSGEKGSATMLVARAAGAMEQLSAMIPTSAPLAERLRNCEYELRDIAEILSTLSEQPDEDPTVLLDRMQSRLDALAKLKRKYGASVCEVLAFRANAAKRLEELDTSGERCEELSHRISELREKAENVAAALHRKRAEAAKEVERKIAEILTYLDMPRVRFLVAVSHCALNATGCDKVEFLIATNPGEPLAPMQKIASGGELSRIMLAIRCVLNDRDGVGCIIYDEVDTGISGSTSRKVGLKLRRISKETQVICVTHSAQIASLADTHFFVSKSEAGGRVQTDVRILTPEEEQDAIARILGGLSVTDAQRQAAADMLAGKDREEL